MCCAASRIVVTHTIIAFLHTVRCIGCLCVGDCCQGLLRAAMKHEDELASRIVGYSPIVTPSTQELNDALHSRNDAVNERPAGLIDAAVVATSYAASRVADAFGQNSSAVARQQWGMAAQLREEAARSSLIKSLTQLQAERELLDLVDDGIKISNTFTKGNQVFYDKNTIEEISYLHAADMYVDPSVLGKDHEAVAEYPHIHNLHVIEDGSGQLADTRTHLTKRTRNPPFQEKFDLKRLNNVHFFDEKYYDDVRRSYFSNRNEVRSSTGARRVAARAVEEGRDDSLNRPLMVIIRHGKTEHNKLGLFTGWEDASLAVEGRAEARHAGRLLRKHGIEVMASLLSL